MRVRLKLRSGLFTDILIVYQLLIFGAISTFSQNVDDKTAPSPPAATAAATTANRTLDAALNAVWIPQPPTRLQHNLPLLVEFRCSRPTVVGVDVRVRTDSRPDGVVAFCQRWRCGDGRTKATDAKLSRRTVRILLPRYLVYSPSAANRYSVWASSAAVQAWMLDPTAYTAARTYRDFHSRATVREEFNVSVTPPFERPKRPFVGDRCPSWWTALRAKLPYRPTCKAELETFDAVSFPVALSGTRTGVHRVLREFSNPALRALRNRRVSEPRFTFSFWLYVVDYCPSGQKLCQIMKHFTWNELYASPLVYFNTNGQVHLELVMENGVVRAYLTPPDFVVPKEEWVQLVVSCYPHRCNVSMRVLSRWQYMRVQIFTLMEQDTLYFDDTIGLFAFGGTELRPTFQGYIGQVTIYRLRALRIDEIPKPSSKHPMFELGLSQREERCKNYIQQINYSIQRSRASLRAIIDHKSCPAVNPMDLFLPPTSVEPPQCKAYSAPRSQVYEPVYVLAREWIMNGWKFDLSDLGNVLVNNATDLLELNGLKNWEQEIVLLLKQASCFGNHDATFMLSVILNYGLVMKSNELQAHSHLMYGAMDGNRLCAMAMGNKHAFGLDGIPQDNDQGYVYYKQVADKTKVDMEEHRGEDVYTELVRLTDEREVKQHTEEDGDLFLWFKHQANQGIFSAQQNMARMLYWGAQGITRDISAALDYYRLAAETGDPQALYDYGIVLLKGHGTKPNLELALKQFERSAAHNHSGAINALGWHSLEIKNNFTEAADRFERAHQLGNKDASFNLGHMYLHGRNKDGLVDRVKAFDYLAAGALRGQLEAGILIAMFNMRGHPRARRNPTLALEWARHVSEHNPTVGKILTRGVRVYRKHNWPAALVYYAMAASTGVEVANFNLAFLCEENYDELSSSMEKECMWRHYNLSTQRVFKTVDPYALIKMAEYHFSGISGRRQRQKAADLYSDAAIKGNGQGLYNLAAMVEEGFRVSNATWQRLNVPASLTTGDDVSLTTYLYSRCMDLDDSEAFLPCTISLYRVQAAYLWNTYYILITLFVSTTLFTTLAVESLTFYKHLVRQRELRNNGV